SGRDGSANGVQTIETAAGATIRLSSPMHWHRRRPVFSHAIFMSPKGPGRLGVLEPPKRFLHWVDCLEIVLPPSDVVLRAPRSADAPADRRNVLVGGHHHGGQHALLHRRRRLPATPAATQAPGADGQ